MAFLRLKEVILDGIITTSAYVAAYNVFFPIYLGEPFSSAKQPSNKMLTSNYHESPVSATLKATVDPSRPTTLCAYVLCFIFFSLLYLPDMQGKFGFDPRFVSSSSISRPPPVKFVIKFFSKITVKT